MTGELLCKRCVKKWLITVLTTVLLGACGSDGQQVSESEEFNDMASDSNCADSSINNASPDSVVCQSFTDGIERLVFTLSPEQLVPPLVLEGATAEANFNFDESSKILSGSVSASGLTGDATAAFIQRGFAGSNGDIVLALEASATVANVLNIPDNTELSVDQSNELLRGEYYINVLTEANKEGEIRGQLLPNHVRSYRVTLSGDQAVPPIDTDASGLGVFTYQSSTDLVWGTIRLSGIDANAANLHVASKGETGPVVVPFTVDPNEQNVWRADAVMADILTEILSGQIYFSATASSDPGEIRGQIPDVIPLGPLTIP